MSVGLQDVAKAFGRVQALRGVTLEVPAGITYGLIGPNGSGKTTLLRVAAGLLRPDRGWVEVLGRRLPDRQVRAQVGYMTQAAALYQELTVRENVEFFAAIYGGRRPEVDAVIELVGLRQRAGSPVHTLSGGLRQRASLACALVHSPRLLLLDEPTVGVDPELRASFWDHFHELNRQGVTILVSSHVMDEAGRCDRLGLLREGVLLAEGTAEDLCRRAATPSLEQAFLAFARGAVR